MGGVFVIGTPETYHESGHQEKRGWERGGTGGRRERRKAVPSLGKGRLRSAPDTDSQWEWFHRTADRIPLTYRRKISSPPRQCPKG